MSKTGVISQKPDISLKWARNASFWAIKAEKSQIPNSNTLEEGTKKEVLGSFSTLVFAENFLRPPS
jgi:hypothetical protein